MNAATEFDLGPLTWVKGEIDLALQRAEEMLRIDAIEAARQMMAASRQVERGADAGNPGDNLAGTLALFATPFQQRVAAERDAGRV